MSHPVCVTITYLIVSMNAAHMSIQTAQLSEHATTLLTEKGVSSFSLRMHSLQHSYAHVLQYHDDTAN